MCKVELNERGDQILYETRDKLINHIPVDELKDQLARELAFKCAVLEMKLKAAEEVQR